MLLPRPLESVDEDYFQRYKKIRKNKLMSCPEEEAGEGSLGEARNIDE